MESTSGPYTGKGPGVRMIIAAVLMVLGSLITGFIVILAMMSRLTTIYDKAVAFIAAILLLLEISFALAVLPVRQRRLPYRPKKMRALAVLMLIVNCGLVLCCVIIDLYYVNWASRQYIPLAFVLLRTVLVPGVLVKIFALQAASGLIPKENGDDEHEEGIQKFRIIAIITAGVLLAGSGIIYFSLV